MDRLRKQEHEEYEAVTRGCAVFEETDRGILELQGRDRTDLLHRITTNDVNSLEAGQGTQTLWLNRQGRILEVLTLYATADVLSVVTEPGQASAVYQRLDQSIFFGDEIQIEDVTSTTKLLYLFGPKCHEVLDSLGMETQPDWPLYHHRNLSVGGVACVVASEPMFYQGGVSLRFRHDASDEVKGALAACGIVDLSAPVYDVLRVEHGYPRFGSELNESVIPLEVGLRGLISFTKGCYVGQEVIARMDSRQRVARHLCGLRLDGPAPAPTQLLAEDKEAGLLTSAVVSPRFGPIGLGLVRRDWVQQGQRLSLAGHDAWAEVVDLPFSG